MTVPPRSPLRRAPLPQIASVDAMVYGRARAKPAAAAAPAELRFDMMGVSPQEPALGQTNDPATPAPALYAKAIAGTEQS